MRTALTLLTRTDLRKICSVHDSERLAVLAPTDKAVRGGGRDNLEELDQKGRNLPARRGRAHGEPQLGVRSGRRP